MGTGNDGAAASAGMIRRMLAMQNAARQSPGGHGIITGPSQLRRGKVAGRNDPCPCGSGEKFKRCCLQKCKPKPPRYRPANRRPRERQASGQSPAVLVQPLPSKDQTALAMLRSGIDEAIVWAFLKTGLFITEANQAAQPADVIERWEAEIQAYENASAEEREAVLPVLTGVEEQSHVADSGTDTVDSPEREDPGEGE